MNQPADIQEKTPKAPGLLPKNVQSWLLAGLAFVMVTIMWLTGGKKPTAPPRTAALSAPSQAPLEVNETKINELQSRIEELQRDQLVAQSALAQQTRLIANGAQDPATAQSATPATTSEPKQEDPEQAERKRRAYVSLFASNVALTYRKGAAVAAAPEPEIPAANPNLAPVGPAAPEVAQLVKEMQLGAASAAVSAVPTSGVNQVVSEINHDRKEQAKTPQAVAADPVNAAAGKPYILFEGTILETVLINRLDGSFSGPVECLLSTDVFSNDRQHLLIPAGSKLLGDTKKVDTFGQSRLAVVFHRAIMPDGYSISLDQFKGLNQIGDTGLRDQVNAHYARIFGVSLAIGALGAIGEAGTAGGLNASNADLMRQGFAQSTAQSSAQILDKFLNVMPTVTIREGHRVKVYLSGDLALPDYHDHKMPSNL